MTGEDERWAGALARGDHVYARRGRYYSHHGIDCGDGSVIHYVGARGSVRYVRRTPLEEFTNGSELRVRAYERRLCAEETVANAESCLGSADYRLLRNNCEHFAAWCCTGQATSSQVRRWFLAAHGTAATLVAVQTLGAHLTLLGTLGAGLYAIAGPVRRSRQRSADAPR